jgi:hypothetical protein
MTPTEGTLAILGKKTIKIPIVGLAGGIPPTPDLPPAEIIAGIPDVKTVATDVPTAEADVLTAGTDATTAAITAAPVETTEILEVILEVVAGRTATEITEAAEAGGRTPEKRGHSDPPAGGIAPTPKQFETTWSLNLAQRPMKQGANINGSRNCILEWREAAIVPPTMTQWEKSAAPSAPFVEEYTMNLTAKNMLNTAKSAAATAIFTTTERRIAARLQDSHRPFQRPTLQQSLQIQKIRST